jgi:threonyl-tRNA synthetase
MIHVTFPDGATRQFEDGATGRDIAGAISKSLAKRAFAVKVDGAVRDLGAPVPDGSALEILTREASESLELIRHDAAHVMAEAVQGLYPGTQVTIGPVIENGFYYDFARDEPFRPDELAAIEARMREIVARDSPITCETWDRERAKQFFGDRGERYKLELIDAIPEDQALLIYKQGEWLDLCRGPHGPSTGGVGSAFKLLKVAGAYWRGDSRNPMLQRIYATAWASDKDLAGYLHMLEEAEKRDHRRLGREMDLFHFQEDAPGTVFWHPKGWTMFQTLVSYVRRRQEKAGYQEVNAPQLLERSLWETSGHWAKYHENMFVTETEDERIFALKPMNCPGHVQIYKHGLKSYRDLPVRLSEFGAVHRYEPSGALHGLMRVRAFTQDDAHVFIPEEMVEAESLAINDLILAIYADFGFDDVLVKLSTRPEQRVGSDELWDRAERSMGDVLRVIAEQAGGRVTTAIAEGEGAFYGPKFEYTLRDAIGRQWQVGTNQVDFNLPGRFGATYVAADGSKQTPVMLHRAMLGSLERFIGIVIEHYAGHFPLWLAPVQIVIATITQDADTYAHEVLEAVRRAGLRAEADLRNEKINYKVREHSLAKVPVMLVVGRREAEERRVAIRRLGGKDQDVQELDEAIAALVREAVPPDLRDGSTPAVTAP